MRLRSWIHVVKAADSLAELVVSGSGIGMLRHLLYFCKFFTSIVVVVHSLSCTPLFVTPWTAACQATLSITNSPSLLTFTFIESMMPSNHLIFCWHLLLLPLIFPSTRVFSSELALHIKWPKYWSFSVSPSSEYSGLISFKIDLFDLLSVQGTLKSLLQYHNLKASVLPCAAFFTIQLESYDKPR